MKATGIVRRIDDLGRVVIPKEIRRTMRIKEGAPLEIFTGGEGEVIFKKYSPIGEISLFATQYTEALSKAVNLPALICDTDNIVAVYGAPKKDFIEKSVSSELESLMNSRVSHIHNKNEKLIKPFDGCERHIVCMAPIISDSEINGAVMYISSDDNSYADEVKTKLITTAAAFLGKQMEG